MAYIEELEKRLLYSADLPGADLALATAEPSSAVHADLDQSSDIHGDIAAQSARRELVIVDARTPDYQRLIDGLQAGDDRWFEILVLDAEHSGIEQISSALTEQRNLSAVHLVSHGAAGELTLGSDTLDNNSLLRHAQAVAGWGDSLTKDGDLLIYGCDLASTDDGQGFVLTLAQLTGADVAASDDPTGHQDLGGDWELEHQVGRIESGVAVDAAVRDTWAHTLALAVDSSSSGSTADQASVTVSHTTAGTNRLMLVGVSIADADSVSSVAYNGASLSLVGVEEDSTGKSRVEIWSLVAPDTGTHDVVVNLTGTAHKGVVVGATTFTGVNQANPTLAFAGDSGLSTTASTTVASAAADLVFGVVASHKGLAATPSAGQTEYWDLATNNAHGSGTTEAGASTVTNSWTVSDGEWAAAAVSVQADSNSAEKVTLLAVQDAYIQASNPTSNTGSGASMIIDREDGDLQRALVQFDLSSIPAGMTIQSATLKLNATAVGGQMNVDAYQLLESWVEGSTSWNERSSGVSWTTAGGEYDATALDTITDPQTGQQSFDITALAHAWASGSQQNYGVMIASPDGGGNRTITYDSREGTVAPMLELVYTEPNVAPTDIALSNATVDEHINTSSGYSVGTLSTTDPNGGDTHSYTIVGGADQANFSIGGAGSNELILVDGILNHEAKNSYQVTVRTTDNGSPNLSYDETLAITVNDLNDAPVLDDTGSMQLTSVLANSTDPAGDLVSAIIASAGGDRITDSDSGAVEGIAVTAVDDSNGTWEFSTNGGGNWTAFGTVADNSAVVLGATANDRVRFVPGTDYSGSATIAFRAWDTTDGSVSGTSGVNAIGGSTAFSSATETASITVEPTEVLLWLSTNQDVGPAYGGGPSGVTGLDSWSDGTVIGMGDPNLSLGAGTTGGTFGKTVDFDLLAGDGNADVNGLHYVTTDITLTGPGISGGSIDLLAGDMLFVVESAETLSTAASGAPAGWSNSIATTGGNIYAYRAENAEDYSSGFFRLIMSGPGSNPTEAITLVESATTIGDTVVDAGDFLFAQSGTIQGPNVYWYDTSADSSVLLIDGDDIGIESGGSGDAVLGIELVEQSATVGGVSLTTGNILLSIDKTDTVGDNNQSVNAQDVFVLNVSATTYGSGTAAATASLLFDGDGSVGFDDSKENLDALSLIIRGSGTNQAPVVGLPGVAAGYTENGAPVVIDGGATVADADSADFAGGILNVSFGANGQATDRLSIFNQGTGMGEIGVSGNDVTYAGTVIGTFSGGRSGSDPLVVNLNANANAANAQALVRNLVYWSTSENPSTLARTVDVVLSDGDGGTSTTVSQTVNVTVQGDAPIAVADSRGLDFDGVDDYVSIADSASLTMTTTVTMEAWIRPDATANVNRMIINKEGEYEVALFADGSLNWAFANTDPGWAWHDTGYVVADDVWSHIAVSYDNGTVRTYVNGTLVDEYLGSGAIGDAHAALDELRIGGRSNNPDGKYFDGVIDDVRIWNTARSQVQIQSNMDTELGGVEAGLAGYWRFNEASGTTVSDLTANGNDGTLVDGGLGAPGPTRTGHITDQDTQINIANTAGVLVNDLDPEGDALTVTQVNGNGTNVGALFTLPSGANLTVTALGAFIYDPNGAFDYLAAGESAVDSFTYQVTDGNGNFATATAKIVITGINDAPVAVDDAGAVDEDATLNIGALAGVLLSNDTDAELDALSVTAIRTGPESGGGTAGTVGVALTGTYGTLTLNADGSYGYVADQPAADALAAGASATDTFTYTTSDGNGGSDSAELNVTITGVNDPPIIGGDAIGAVSEDGTLSDSGALTISDADTGEDVFTAQTGATSTSGYGTVDLDAAGNWTYTLDNGNATVQALSGGETLADSFTAVSADGSTQVVSITITGANDAPSIGGTTSGAVSEDGTLTDSGALTITDTDDGEDVFTAQTGAASTSGYGTVDLDAAGNWTYTLDNSNATVQALSGGETLADSFTATSADGSTVVVNLTITGANDAPTIGGDAAGSVSEDGTLTDSGALTISDTDDGEDVFTAQTSAASTGGYGTVDLDAAGNWTYTLDNGNATVQALSGGETLADSFTATSADGSTQVVSITITGTNDAPTIGGDAAGSVSEDGTLTDSGALTISDTDDGEAVFTAQTGAASTSGYGTVDLDAAGNWTYTLDNANATVQALSGGETLADSFTAVSADGTTQVVSITITGADDAAVIGGDATGAVTEDGTLTDSGTLTISDTDDGEDVFTAQTGAASTSGYGTVDLDAAGNWTYTLDNANATVQALSGGETLADSFTAVSADGSTQVVSITITGANDAPSIGGTTSGAVSEDGTLTDSGALTISDTDDGEAVFTAQIGTASTSGYGTVDLDAAGNWTYTLDNSNATVQALSAGETLADTFTAVSADGTTRVVNITITGANDAPSIGGTTSGAVSEDGTLTDSGALTISDTDDGEDVFTAQTGAASTSGYGTVDLDAAGNWTYTLDNSNATIQALSAGETLADSFTAVTADGTTRVVNITITGANDVPTIGGTTSGAVSEDGTLTDSGALTISDVDDGEDVFTAQTGAASTDGYGTVDLDAAGNWTYTLDNANATVQALSAGETLADSFTAVSADGSVQVVNITITGANDVPTIGGTTSGAVSEDGTLTDSGALTISDVDDGEDVFTAQTGAASTDGYGTVDLDAAGNWTYTLDNANATVQALSGGETLADSFTATSADGSTVVVNLTITGANDAPSIGGDATGTVTEDGTLTDSGTLTISDTDDGEDVFTAQTGAASTSGYGTVDLDAAGNWTYTLDNGNATVQALSGGETLADSFTAVSADGSVQVVNITITGANDAPVIGSDGGGANASVNAQENQTGVTTVVASDIDNSDTFTYAISGGADAGLFSIDPSSGVLTFDVAPDFETPTDANGDGIYEIVVRAVDSLGGADDQTLGVQVLDQSFTVPADQVFTSAELASNGQILGQLQTLGDQPTSFVITGGDAAAAFAVDATGRISIADVTLLTDGSDSYQLEIAVSDGTTSISQTVAIETERVIAPDPVDPPDLGGPPVVPPTELDPPPVAEDEDEIDEPEPPALTPTVTTATDPAGGDGDPKHREETTAFDAQEIVIASDLADDDAGRQMTAYRVVEPVPLFARMMAAKLLISSGVLDLGSGPTAPLPFDTADDAAFWASLDVVMADLDAAGDGADDDMTLFVEAAGAAALSLTVGFVVWVLRTGALAASLLSVSPLWRQIDPLPVLRGSEADSDDAWAFGIGGVDDEFALGRPDEVPERRSGRSDNG